MLYLPILIPIILLELILIIVALNNLIKNPDGVRSSEVLWVLIILLVVIILFAGLLVDEYQRNTLPMLLTKNLKSESIILGKFLVCLLYIWIYFQTGISIAIFGGALSILLIYFLVIALFLFLGALFSKTGGVLLSTVICLLAMLLANIHPGLESRNPVSLLNAGTSFIQKNMSVSKLAGAYKLLKNREM